MRHRRIAFLFVAGLALLVAACGGDGEKSVPRDAIAVVGDREISKEEYDQLIDQAKRGYEAQKRDFPKAGTTEFNAIKNQAVQYLVQRAQFEQKAEELDVEVTDKQIEDRLEQIKKQYFGGNEKRYTDQLKEQGLSDEQVRRDIRAQLLQEAIFKAVTDKVQVTDKDIEDYYKQNTEQYGTPESRDVRHILVPTKKLADDLYDRLKNGGDFAKLAKQYSKDPGSKDQGGKLTIARGQTVEPFDQTAFLLPVGSLSRPVKTQYGYHLIEPLSAVKPAKTTPLAQVKESIRQQLLSTERNESMTTWVEDTRKEFCDGNLTYQVGFQPKPDPCAEPGATTGTGSVTTTG